MYFLYILRTPSNTLYIGVTAALDQRITTHNSGKGAEWTKVHKGGVLVYSETYSTLGSARRREIQLKKWTRAKKEALIAGDLVKLKSLSHRHNIPPHFSAHEPRMELSGKTADFLTANAHE
jgi:putative endonuclease